MNVFFSLMTHASIRTRMSRRQLGSVHIEVQSQVALLTSRRLREPGTTAQSPEHGGRRLIGRARELRNDAHALFNALALYSGMYVPSLIQSL
jgi:hypothetical protein